MKPRASPRRACRLPSVTQEVGRPPRPLQSPRREPPLRHHHPHPQPAGAAAALPALAGQPVRTATSGSSWSTTTATSRSPAAVAEVVAEGGFAIEPTVLRLPQPSGPSAGRNAGVAASDATYVLFLDDDVVVDRHLVEVHLSEVRQGEGAERCRWSRAARSSSPSTGARRPWNLWEARMATRGTIALVRGDYEITWRQFHTGNNCMPRDLFQRRGRLRRELQAPRGRRVRAADPRGGVRVPLRARGAGLALLEPQPGGMAGHPPRLRPLHGADGPPLPAGRVPRRPQVGAQPEQRRSSAPRGWSPAVRGAPRLAVARPSPASGQLSHRIGLTPVTMAAFSLAFDLTYVQSMRDTEASDEQPPPRTG